MKTNQTFSAALDAVKQGKNITCGDGSISLHKGNIDGLKLGFNPGEQPQADHPSSINGVKLGLFECGDVDTTIRLPHLSLLRVDGVTVTGWQPTQLALLREDWVIID